MCCSDWVHDRFEEDRYENSRRGPRDDYDQYEPRGGRRPAAYAFLSLRILGLNSQPYREGGAKVRVDNIHYDLTEDDLRVRFLCAHRNHID